MKTLSNKKSQSDKFVFKSNPNVKKPTTDYGNLIINALKKSKKA